MDLRSAVNLLPRSALTPFSPSSACSARALHRGAHLDLLSKSCKTPALPLATHGDAAQWQGVPWSVAKIFGKRASFRESIEASIRLDILVQVEQVVRIVLGLERNKSLVVRTVGRANTRCPFFTEKVDVGALARKTL
jgi:hypothetical protein